MKVLILRVSQTEPLTMKKLLFTLMLLAGSLLQLSAQTTYIFTSPDGLTTDEIVEPQELAILTADENNAREAYKAETDSLLKAGWSKSQNGRVQKPNKLKVPTVVVSSASQINSVIGTAVYYSNGQIGSIYHNNDYQLPPLNAEKPAKRGVFLWVGPPGLEPGTY